MNIDNPCEYGPYGLSTPPNIVERVDKDIRVMISVRTVNMCPRYVDTGKWPRVKVAGQHPLKFLKGVSVWRGKDGELKVGGVFRAYFSEINHGAKFPSMPKDDLYLYLLEIRKYNRLSESEIEKIKQNCTDKKSPLTEQWISYSSDKYTYIGHLSRSIRIPDRLTTAGVSENNSISYFIACTTTTLHYLSSPLYPPTLSPSQFSTLCPPLPLSSILPHRHDTLTAILSQSSTANIFTVMCVQVDRWRDDAMRDISIVSGYVDGEGVKGWDRVVRRGNTGRAVVGNGKVYAVIVGYVLCKYSIMCSVNNSENNGVRIVEVGSGVLGTKVKFDERVDWEDRDGSGLVIGTLMRRQKEGGMTLLVRRYKLAIS